MRQKYYCSISAGVALALGILAPVVVFGAQTGAAQAGSAAEATDRPTSILHEVIVSAQKREESMQDVGVSVAAFSGEMLTRMGVAGTDDLMAMTPGLQWASFGGVPTLNVFSLRGVSQTSFEDHQEPPVAAFIDGVYTSFMGSAAQWIFDVERVEVLRGPQGTLFGRNSTGGVIHTISKRPTRYVEGYTKLTAGEFGHAGFEGALSGPLAETVAGRIAATYRREDGWWKNLAGKDKAGVDSFAWRAQLDITPSDSFGLLLNARGSVDDIKGVGAFDVKPAILDADGLGAFPASDAAFGSYCESAFGVPAIAGQTNCFGYVKPVNSPHKGESDTEGYFKREIYGFSATATWDLAGPTLVSITDYQKVEKDNFADEDGTSMHLLDFLTAQDSSQFSQEIRVSGDAGRVRYTTGLYYLMIDGDYQSSVIIPPFGLTTLQSYSLETSAYSAFGQLEVEVAPRWTVIGGLRWSRDEKDFKFAGNCEGAVCAALAPPGSLQAEGLVADLTDDGFEFKLQANWAPTDDLLLYAGVTQGYKAGGFNAPVLANMPVENTTFDGERLLNYEVGIKSELFGNTRLNASVFYYDYTDVQTFSQAQAVTTILNADGRVIGGEIELATRPREDIELQLGVSLLDAEVFGIRLPSGRIADRTLPFSPKSNINALALKEWPAFTGMLSLQLDASYVARQQYSVFNAPVTQGRSYTVANARLAFSSGDETWSAALLVKNLFNEGYSINGFDNAGLSGVALMAPGKPRWTGVQFSYRW